jgi:hypothetical protein
LSETTSAGYDLGGVTFPHFDFCIARRWQYGAFALPERRKCFEVIENDKHDDG